MGGGGRWDVSNTTIMISITIAIMLLGIICEYLRRIVKALEKITAALPAASKSASDEQSGGGM